MISDERLEWLLVSPSSAGRNEWSEIAKELLARRPCQHHWNTLRLVEAGGRYQYCTLCGSKKVAE